MKTIHCIKLCATTLALSNAMASTATAQESTPLGTEINVVRPNVLFIICDDLNDWALHPPEHPKAKTPHIDRLRSMSMNFANAHAVVPVCGPSRKCLFSGLYPQTIDNYDFETWGAIPSLKECVPIPLHFRNNGYNSYGTGKLLHHGAEGDFYTDYGIAPDYGPWPWKGKGNVGQTPHPAQFDKWIPYLPEQYHRDLNYGPLSNVPEWKADAIKGIPGAKGWYSQKGKPFKYTDDNNRDKMPDEISADWAIDILKKKHERPFYLGVGFIRPPLTKTRRSTALRPKDEAAFLCAGWHFPFEAARGRNEPCQDRPQSKRGKRCLIHRHQSHIRGFYAMFRPQGEERAGRHVRSERIKTSYVGLVLSERLWRLFRHPTS